MQSWTVGLETHNSGGPGRVHGVRGSGPLFLRGGQKKGIAMLILTRRRDERIVIRDSENPATVIVLEVVDVRGQKVRIGIEAPQRFAVDREEIDSLKRGQRRRGALVVARIQGRASTC